MSIFKKDKAIRLILIINFFALLAAPIVHGITGTKQPIIASIALVFSLVTTVIAVIMNRKEKKAAAARSQRLYS
jgi:uncharacterized membrane protein (DUF485 family)